MKAINRISRELNKEARSYKRTKYRLCKYCLNFCKITNYLKKKNYTRHIYDKHFGDIKDPKKIEMFSAKYFFTSSYKALKNLDKLNGLLKQIIKFKINKRKISKKSWHKLYKKNIKNLIKVLKDKINGNDEDEDEDGDGINNSEEDEKNNN